MIRVLVADNHHALRAGLVLLLVQAAASCAPSGDRVPGPKEFDGSSPTPIAQVAAFQRIATYGNETDAILAVPHLVRVDRGGSVYVFDAASSEVRCFEAGGSLRWTVGGPGAGPGEFEWPTGMLVWRDLLLVFNRRGERVDALDTASGRVVWSTLLEEESHPGFIPQDILGDSLIVGKDRLQGRIGAQVLILQPPSMRIVASFNVDEPSDDLPTTFSSLPDIRVVDGLIAVGSHTREQIRLYDLTGRLVSSLDWNRGNMIHPGFWSSADGRNSNSSTFSWINAPWVVPGGTRLVHARWPKGRIDANRVLAPEHSDELSAIEYDGAWDLLDVNWDRLASATPEEWSELGLSGLVAVHPSQPSLFVYKSKPFPHIEKFQVVIRSPK